MKTGILRRCSEDYRQTLFPVNNETCSLGSLSPTTDKYSVRFSDNDNICCTKMSSELQAVPVLNDKVRFNYEKTSIGNEVIDEEDDEDYSASISAILQRKASSRKGKRRVSSPFSHEDFSAHSTPRRRSSGFTSTSTDTAAISIEEPGITQEQIYENIRLHKEVITNVKLQPWSVKRKLKLVQQAKAYIKKHEGELQVRLKQSRSTRDILARFNIVLIKKWQHMKREVANLMNALIPWECRIKEIESHFGSVVASYFTFLRWLFWVNLVISIALATFVIAPEMLMIKHKNTGERKVPLDEEKSSTLNTFLNFEGILKYSPIFYGYYSNREGGEGYMLPTTYFMVGLAVYVYSFIATLRKMAINFRLSKLSEKEDECIFTWKLFTGWDYMIGNAETAHNRTSSIVLGFKEALLEEAEKKKENQSWKIITLRVFVNINVLWMLICSALAVVYVVDRSNEPQGASKDSSAIMNWWHQNEISVVMTAIGSVFPLVFEIFGFIERYHPRKTLRIQLARIMALNLLNIYTMTVALFVQINGMTVELQQMKISLNESISGSYHPSACINTTSGPDFMPLQIAVNRMELPSFSQLKLDHSDNVFTNGSFKSNGIETNTLFWSLTKATDETSSITPVDSFFETNTTSSYYTDDSIQDENFYTDITNAADVSNVGYHNTEKNDLCRLIQVDCNNSTFMTTTDSVTTEEQSKSSGISATTATIKTIATLSNRDMFLKSLETFKDPAIPITIEKEQFRLAKNKYKNKSQNGENTSELTGTTENDVTVDNTFYMVGTERLNETLESNLNFFQDYFTKEPLVDDTTTDITTTVPCFIRYCETISTITDKADYETTPYSTTANYESNVTSSWENQNFSSTVSTEKTEVSNVTTLFADGGTKQISKSTVSEPSSTYSTDLQFTVHNISTVTPSNYSSALPSTFYSVSSTPFVHHNVSSPTIFLFHNLSSTAIPSSTVMHGIFSNESSTINLSSGESPLLSMPASSTTSYIQNYTQSVGVEDQSLQITENVTPVITSKTTGDYSILNTSTMAVPFSSPCTPIGQSYDPTMDLSEHVTKLNTSERLKLRRLCWETMFGQELVKLTVLDLVTTIWSTFFMDFIRALFVRFLNKCWCWDLEKKFPKYGDFKIAENILHLVNNQGMVWMGMFFSPGLPIINVIKLMVMMYLRSWAVLTCNVPHEVVFRASRSNNFYLALLLTMLFLCVLPVGYAIVGLEPSWHCGPFSNHKKIYLIFTKSLKNVVPKSLHHIMDYIASPGTVIPLLLVLLLVIYYLASLTSALREANNDLKVQLRRERTEERRKMFQMASRRRRGGSEIDSTLAKWRKILQDVPSTKLSVEDASPTTEKQQNFDQPKEDRGSKKSTQDKKKSEDKRDNEDDTDADNKSLIHDEIKLIKKVRTKLQKQRAPSCGNNKWGTISQQLVSKKGNSLPKKQRSSSSSSNKDIDDCSVWSDNIPEIKISHAQTVENFIPKCVELPSSCADATVDDVNDKEFQDSQLSSNSDSLSTKTDTICRGDTISSKSFSDVDDESTTIGVEDVDEDNDNVFQEIVNPSVHSLVKQDTCNRIKRRLQKDLNVESSGENNKIPPITATNTKDVKTSIMTLHSPLELEKSEKGKMTKSQSVNYERNKQKDLKSQNRKSSIGDIYH